MASNLAIWLRRTSTRLVCFLPKSVFELLSLFLYLLRLTELAKLAQHTAPARSFPNNLGWHLSRL